MIFFFLNANSIGYHTSLKIFFLQCLHGQINSLSHGKDIRNLSLNLVVMNNTVNIDYRIKCKGEDLALLQNLCHLN